MRVLISAMKNDIESLECALSEKEQGNACLEATIGELRSAAISQAEEVGALRAQLFTAISAGDAASCALTMGLWKPISISGNCAISVINELIQSYTIPKQATVLKGVYDIPSMASYILCQREDIAALFTDEIANGPSLQEHLSKSGAKFQSNLSSFSPEIHVLVNKQAAALKGDEHRRSDISDIITAAMACDHSALRARIAKVQDTGHITATLCVRSPIASTTGMGIILSESSKGMTTYKGTLSRNKG